MFIPKTIIVVASVTVAALSLGAGGIFLSGNDTSSADKKTALEAHKFSSAQLPTGARCYDHILAGIPQSTPEIAAASCKCLVNEVGKYGPALQPPLRALMLIGLQATAETSSSSQRTEFVNRAFRGDPVLTELDTAQHPALQKGIMHVMKSCKVGGTS